MTNTEQINQLALDIGAVTWAYTESLSPFNYQKFTDWVKNGKSSPLRYLEDYRATQRASLKNIFPEYQSMIIFLFSYADKKAALEKLNLSPKISGYSVAYNGIDYHYVLKEKLQKVADSIHVTAKIGVDTLPILERDFAVYSGLGFIGKNSMLINPKFGSYTLVGSILLDTKLDIQTKNIITDHCGHCTKCIDACPTSAIDLNKREINSSLCLSTYTVEPVEMSDEMLKVVRETDRVFGCDICQEVCPWNLKPILNANKVELPKELFEKISKKSLEKMSNSQFKKELGSSPFFRKSKKGLLKNLS